MSPHKEEYALGDEKEDQTVGSETCQLLAFAPPALEDAVDMLIEDTRDGFDIDVFPLTS